VSVAFVDCPDLSSEPFYLPTKGICGKSTIADIGGVDNLHFTKNHGKVFEMGDIAATVGQKDAPLIIGPGAGSAKVVGVNSELIVNVNLATHVHDSKCAKVTDNGSYIQFDYNSTQFGLLANLMISQGQPGKVLEVKASERTGNLNFVTCMRKAVEERFPDHVIGLAGVINISKGSIKAHVMPDFPSCNLESSKEVEEWLKFYEMKAPLTCHTVFVSRDFPNKMGLRLEHTHFYSKHGDAGHYHYDITPDQVEYTAYLVLCEKIHRVDAAQI